MADSLNGLLLVNKPAGISTYDIIRRVKQVLRETAELPLNHRGKRILPKIGHAGTLDPAAEGLVLLVFGMATKQSMKLVKLDKAYYAEITLGSNSSTGDRDGELSQVSDRKVEKAEITATIPKFTGTITQTPSVYSAIKIDGKEAYKRARAGEEVTMPSREVQIYSNQLLAYEYPTIQLRVRVSSGTYIRSLAEDIGQLLGTGGYLTMLRREVVGKYELKDALDLDLMTLKAIQERLLEI